MVEIDPVIKVSRFVNFFNILSPFRFYLPLEKGVTLDLYKFESPCTQGCFVPSLVEIGLVVLVKKIFKSCLFIFIISQLSPLWEGRGPSFEQT